MSSEPEPWTDDPAPSAGGRPCPACGASLSEPVRGDVHCYVYCVGCGTEFPLDDPALPPAHDGVGRGT